jgi:hypothetical protein
MPDVSVCLDPDLPAAIRVVFTDATTGDEAIAVMDYQQAQELVVGVIDLLGQVRHRRTRLC